MPGGIPAANIPTTGAGAITVALTPAGNSCTPTYSTGGSVSTIPFSPVHADHPTLQGYETAYVTSQQTWQDSAASLYGRMDLGRHSWLMNYIDTAGDTGALYATLLGASPYLSGMAFMEAAGTMALSPGAITSLLEGNPDLLRNPAINSFTASAYTFPQSVLWVLASYALDSTTARTVATDSIANGKMEMGYYGNLIMMALLSPNDTNLLISDSTDGGICTDSTSVYYLLDSNNMYSNIDSVDAWLQHIGGVWSNYARVGYYNQLQQYAIADSIFNSIQARSLAADSMSVIATGPSGATPQTGPAGVIADTANIKKIWDVIYNAETSASPPYGIRNLYSLDSADIAALDTTSVITYPGNTANRLINTITNIINPSSGYGQIVGFLCEETGPFGRKSNGADSGKTQAGIVSPLPGASGGQQFSVFPNPTTGVVTFSYNVPDAGGDVRIVITNVVGEEEATLHTGNNSGTVQWNRSAIAPGMYIYQASDANGIIRTGKIVVTR